MIQHVRLNRVESPCEEAEDYRFVDCINLSVASQVGCQGFWSDYPDLPTCSNMEQIVSLMENYQEMMTMEKLNLTKVSGCLDPCTYMEYKVNIEWSGKPRTVEYFIVKILYDFVNFYKYYVFSC